MIFEPIKKRKKKYIYESWAIWSRSFPQFQFFFKTYCCNLFVIHISQPMNQFTTLEVTIKIFLLFNKSSFSYQVTLTYKKKFHGLWLMGYLFTEFGTVLSLNQIFTISKYVSLRCYDTVFGTTGWWASWVRFSLVSLKRV